MAIDPVTGGLILGGLNTLGGLLAGDSPAEEAQKYALKQVKSNDRHLADPRRRLVEQMAQRLGITDLLNLHNNIPGAGPQVPTMPAQPAMPAAPPGRPNPLGTPNTGNTFQPWQLGGGAQAQRMGAAVQVAPQVDDAERRRMAMLRLVGGGRY